MAGDDDRTTIREFIEQLMEVADQVGGLDAPIELAICNRHDKQFIDRVEVTWQHAYDEATGELVIPSRDNCALILGHWHPDESPGRLHRGITTVMDEELRKLTEGDDGGE